jgi:hypothetical protein
MMSGFTLSFGGEPESQSHATMLNQGEGATEIVRPHITANGTIGGELRFASVCNKNHENQLPRRMNHVFFCE